MKKMTTMAVDDHDEVKRALELLSRAQTDRRATDDEINTIHSTAARATAADGLREAAKSYLDGAGVSPDSTLDTRERLEAAGRRRAVLLEAETVARARLAQARDRAAREAAKVATPEYRRLSRAAILAALALARAAGELRTFRDELLAAGVAPDSHLELEVAPHSILRWAPLPGEQGATVEYAVRWAVAVGAISEGEARKSLFEAGLREAA